MNELDEDYEYLYDYIEMISNGEDDLSVNLKELIRILRCFDIKNYGIKSIIIEPDEECDGFYYIKRGE